MLISKRIQPKQLNTVQTCVEFLHILKHPGLFGHLLFVIMQASDKTVKEKKKIEKELTCKTTGLAHVPPATMGRCGVGWILSAIYYNHTLEDVEDGLALPLCNFTTHTLAPLGCLRSSKWWANWDTGIRRKSSKESEQRYISEAFARCADVSAQLLRDACKDFVTSNRDFYDRQDNKVTWDPLKEHQPCQYTQHH